MKRVKEYRNIRTLREARDNEKRSRVYCGTYGKYNDGSIDGDWMTLGDYDSLDDFYDACRELHSDEEDPELMFQDCEYLPHSLYSESGVSEEAFDFAKWIDNGGDYDAAEAYINIFGEWDEDDFEEKYRGEYDSDEDFCWEFINEGGGISEAVSHPEYYFDFDHFGHELKWDMDEEEDSQYLEMDDAECGEQWIEDVYGNFDYFAESNPETVETYFDIREYASDVMMTDVHESNGYYFWAQ